MKTSGEKKSNWSLNAVSVQKQRLRRGAPVFIDESLKSLGEEKTPQKSKMESSFHSNGKVMERD